MTADRQPLRDLSELAAPRDAVTDEDFDKLREATGEGRGTDEPGNGSYVAVEMPDHIWVFQRDDEMAADQQEPDRNWFLCTRLGEGEDGSDRTWAEVRRLGPLAYIGVFVDRRALDEMGS